MYTRSAYGPSAFSTWVIGSGVVPPGVLCKNSTMSERPAEHPQGNLVSQVRAAARQDRFLDVVLAEEARARFERHIDLSPLPAETTRAGISALGMVPANV